MIHFPEGLDASFYSQLTAEVWEPNRRRGVKVRPRNEALDA
jgi:phage terminase large subunit GpA-like protein